MSEAAASLPNDNPVNNPNLNLNDHRDNVNHRNNNNDNNIPRHPNMGRRVEMRRRSRSWWRREQQGFLRERSSNVLPRLALRHRQREDDLDDQQHSMMMEDMDMLEDQREMMLLMEAEYNQSTGGARGGRGGRRAQYPVDSDDDDDVDDQIRMDMEAVDEDLDDEEARAFEDRYEYRFDVIRRRRRRMAVLLEDYEKCVVCQSYAGSSSVCTDCLRLKSSHSPPVWKAWMAREQADYQRHFGCSQWNRYRSGVHLQRNVVTPELLLLKRVKACIGWAIHGLIFEFLDGTRAGFVVDVTSIYDDAAIARRRCTEWVEIERGDYVRSIKGHHLSRGCFLCHTLELTLASGRTLRFASDHTPWKGEAFAFDLPECALLHHVSFREGKCTGVTAAETVMHLPCSPKRVSALPRVHQQTFHLLQLVARRLDANREDQGDKPLGKDLWNIILTEYLACHDLQPYDQSPIGKLEQQQQQPSPTGQPKIDSANGSD